MQLKETFTHVNLQPVTIYQDEFVQIDADERAQFVLVKWLKHPDSGNFRKSFQKAAELTIANKYTYWLSDSRAIHYIEFADQNWMLENMAPLLPQVALQKFARLTTLESLSLLDGTRIYNTLEKLPATELKTEFEVFTDQQAALEWLFPNA